MPESISGELVALRERAERFARDVLLPNKAAMAAGQPTRRRGRTSFAPHVTPGFFAMTQPRSVGGAEAGLLALTVVRDTLRRRSTPGLRTTRSDPGPGVLAGCAEPLRSRYLMPLLAGEKRAGFAFTEPDDAPHFTRAVASRRRTARHRPQVVCHRRRQRGFPERAGRDRGPGPCDARDRHAMPPASSSNGASTRSTAAITRRSVSTTCSCRPITSSVVPAKGCRARCGRSAIRAC